MEYKFDCFCKPSGSFRQRRDVETVAYSKPEITLLGNANRVIHGIKNDPINVDINIFPARHSFELED